MIIEVLTDITVYSVRSSRTHCIYISALGDGWGPTLLETEEEWNFLRGAMGLFTSTYDSYTYIGGSTSSCWQYYDFSFDYSQYNANESYCTIMMAFFMLS